MSKIHNFMNSILFLSDTVTTASVSQIIMTYLLFFIIGCLIGYLCEVLFRRFFSAKKWVNPGFLKGPWLPLYGCGLVLMMGFCNILLLYLPESFVFYNPLGDLYGRTLASGPTAYDLIPLGIIWVSLMLLEFIAGLIFVKGFKVRLWDYTNMKGNIMGIVCPLFNLIWLAVDVLFYYALDPFIYKAMASMFNFMFEGGVTGTAVNFVFIFILGIVYGIFIIDVITSMNLFSKISSAAKKAGEVLNWEKTKDEAKKKMKESRKKLESMIPESVREKSAQSKEKNAERTEKLVYKLKEATLIDPNKSSKDNYGEDNRPVKEDSVPAFNESETSQDSE